ncbi:MAG TPA: hypothetical protein VEC99_08590, partial [Clostridia bacterium]|nr:hypothetical protein [Clostridia bacterium]
MRWESGSVEVKDHGQAKANGTLLLPMRAIAEGLPPQLHSTIRASNLDGITIPIPVDLVVPQLKRGKVEIPFGILYLAAPHLFSAKHGCEDVLITLPSKEILASLKGRAKPSGSPRTTTEALKRTNGEGRPENANAAVATKSHSPAHTPPHHKRNHTASVTTPRCPKAPQTKGEIKPTAPGSDVTPPPASAVSSPTSVPEQKGSPRNDTSSILLTINAASTGWPEALLMEISQKGLAQAKLALPIDTIKRQLKKGRLVFPWKSLRSWIQPPPTPCISLHDEVMLDLPLQVVTPLFLATQRNTQLAEPTVSLDEDIPDVFSPVRPAPSVAHLEPLLEIPSQKLEAQPDSPPRLLGLAEPAPAPISAAPVRANGAQVRATF